MAGVLARDLGDHPGLVLWHVGNEFGAHGHCWCQTSDAAFRTWLRDRYGDLDGLNDAWGTRFWGQRYSAWEQVCTPRVAPMPGNPAQALDYRRFSSDELLACYRSERDAVREHTPAGTPWVPATTNFMATECEFVDYWRWAGEGDVVTNDHYLTAAAPRLHLGLAL